MSRFRILAILAFAIPLAGADWKPLFNGKDLAGWEIRGDGQWTVMRDGTILGQRTTNLRKQLVPGGPLATPKEFSDWVNNQSWLYTIRNDFGEFDLHLEYWTKTTGNSGVSIRDTSRAKDERNRRVVRPENRALYRDDVGTIIRVDEFANFAAGLVGQARYLPKQRRQIGDAGSDRDQVLTLFVGAVGPIRTVTLCRPIEVAHFPAPPVGA